MMVRSLQVHRCALLAVLFTLFPVRALPWSIPGHMLNGAIAYQILQQENPSAIPRVRTVLQQHPWYESRWLSQLQKVPESERDELLFMLASRWADDVRTKDRDQNRPLWHYISLPFKPAGEPANIRISPPQEQNILAALVENERTAKDTDAIRKATAVSWLFHLVGDVHQPLHSTQIFNALYPNGDQRGSQICIRQSLKSNPRELHSFWDAIVTSHSTVTNLRREATILRNRIEFERNQLEELTDREFDSWAKESFEIATRIAHQNGATVGTPKSGAKTCGALTEVKPLPAGYERIAGRIAARRIMLAGFRLADLLKQLGA